MSNTNEYTNTHMKWKQETKGLLQRKGLWEIIRSATVNDVSVDGQKALGYIKKDLDHSGHETIRGIETPLEAWTALETNFQLTYTAGKEIYECELQRFQWNGCDLELNYKQFLSLREMYIGCGGTQSPQTYGNYFLRGMNVPEIDSTKQSMLGRNKTLEEVIARCRVVTAQLKISTGNEASAYAAKSSSYDRNNDGRTCYRCKKSGHAKYECPEGGFCSKCNKNGHPTTACKQHLRCDFCDKRGHEGKDCRKKKRENSNEEGHRFLMAREEIIESDLTRKMKLKEFQASELRRINGFSEHMGETCLHMYWDNLQIKLTQEWKGDHGTIAFAKYMENGIQEGYSKYVEKGYVNLLRLKEECKSLHYQAERQASHTAYGQSNTTYDSSRENTATLNDIDTERQASHTAYGQQYKTHDSSRENTAHLNQASNEAANTYIKTNNVPCNECPSSGHIEEEREIQHQAYMVKVKQCENWIMDSGATSHVFCGNRDVMTNYNVVGNMKVNGASGHAAKVKGKGDINMGKVTLRNVLHVPEFKENLISLSVIERNGFKVVLEDGKCRVYDGNTPILQGYRNGNLYQISHDVMPEKCFISVVNIYEKEESTEEKEDILEVDWKLWHSRMGHPGQERLESIFEGRKIKVKKQVLECLPCIVGKQTREYKSKKKVKESKYHFGEMLHVDLNGPMETISIGGGKYGLPIVEDSEGFIVGYVLPRKSDSETNIQDTVIWYKTQFSVSVKCIRADKGGEFISKAFKNWCKERGIELQYTHTGESRENGVAERTHRSLMNTVRTLLEESGLPQRFWAEAYMTAIKNQNAMKHKRTGRIPYRAAYNKNPDWELHRPFGCLVSYLDTKSGKLGKRGRKGVMIGYNSSNTKGYRIMDLDTERVISSGNVKFFEEIFPMALVSTDLKIIYGNGSSQEEDSDESCNDQVSAAQIAPSAPAATASSSAVSYLPQPAATASSSRGRQSRPRTRARTRLLKDLGESSSEDQDDENEAFISKVHTDSVASLLKQDEQKWKGAMESEIQQLKDANTFELVKREKDMKIINTMWVMTEKFKADGSFDKVRPRLVLCGNQVDSTGMEVFAPVASLESVRLVTAIATQNKWNIGDGDIKLAYPHATLREPVYARIPQGSRTEANRDKVWKVTKALYGHPASGKEWYDLFRSKLMNRNLKPLLSDPCIFVNEDLIVTIYVDDMLIVEKRKGARIDLIKSLETEFELTGNTNIKNMLGVEMNQGHDYTMMKQDAYIRNILIKFKMEDCKGQPTPAAHGQDMNKEGNRDTTFEYRQAIGCLLWLSRGTRPDIAQAVAKVARFVEYPTTEHVKSVKRIFRYLASTIDLEMRYYPKNEGIIAYVDADFGGCTETRKSTTGFWITWNNMPIAWQSKLQSMVTLSTTEAEFVAAVECIKDMKWMKNVLMELDQMKKNDIMILLEDNQATISNLKHPSSRGRNKHLDLKFHYIVNQIEDNVIDIKYVTSENNIADIFTKALPLNVFKKHCTSMYRMGGCVEYTEYAHHVEVEIMRKSEDFEVEGKSSVGENIEDSLLALTTVASACNVRNLFISKVDQESAKTNLGSELEVQSGEGKTR